MSQPKGVISNDKYITITVTQAAELQRNWSQMRQVYANDHRFYDTTRKQLNFEIGKGGIVMPRLSGGLITDRLSKRWHDLDYRPLCNSATKTPIQNGVVGFVMSGDNDIMCNLAFGDQCVDFSRRPDVNNSCIVRFPQIEQWAKDCYHMVADLYGEDNIVGCDAHLDEQTPHMHIEFVPLMVNARGQQKVSVSHHFGHPWQISALHDNYYHYVGCKYNLARGDAPTNDVVAHHLSIRDYIRAKQALEREIIALQKQKNKLEEQNILRTPKFKI